MIDYRNTQYKELIRITLEDKQFIASLVEGRQSMANKLQEIIKYYKLYGHNAVHNSRREVKSNNRAVKRITAKAKTDEAREDKKRLNTVRTS
jgi:hypothetical protein